MHMTDALLSPAVGAVFWAGTLTAIAGSARKMRKTADERIIPLMGVLGAFVFAAQMINFTIPATGSSGHLGGGLMLAVVLGPYAGFLVIASVLMIQAFFFADGGLLALGCNIWNLGVYPCFIACPLIYRSLTKTSSSSSRILPASLLAAALGLLLGAFSVALQTSLSGISELPFRAFLPVMLLLHIPIGVIEGIATAGIVNYIRRTRPELLEDRYDGSFPAGVSLRKIFALFLFLALLTGGVLSWYASSHPDGLERSIEKISGRRNLSDYDTSVYGTLKGFQNATSILPDYGFRKGERNKGAEGDVGSPGEDQGSGRIGTSVSGIVGSILVFGIIICLGFILKRLRRRPKERGQ